MKFRPDLRAFTTKTNGIVRELKNQIYISEAHDPATGHPEPIRQAYDAIWDTGATGTVINPKIAQELNLQPSGRETVYGVGAGEQSHEYEANTYLVNIYLPNNVGIVGVRVTEGGIAGADVLLGMDIIAFGDFAITNHNGQTRWTFRTPSNEPIDFVEEINEHNRKHEIHVTLPSQDEKRRQRNRDKKRQQREREKKRKQKAGRK